MDKLEVRIDPPSEWKQIFDEVWRINRDFFYDPNMHGADWEAMGEKLDDSWLGIFRVEAEAIEQDLRATAAAK